MAPLHPHSDQVHAEKYRLPDESFPAHMERIATGLADNETHKSGFKDALLGMRFMPAGRIQAAIGSPKNVTPYNCFVSGTIHDSFVHGDDEGRNSIMDIALQAAATMRMGGGIGYDWSTLRPSGAAIEGVQSTTDGPLAFMHINDAVCKATSSAGNRRGAQMGVLRIDHPDIESFITAKQPDEQMQVLWDLVDAMPGDHPNRAQAVMALQSTLQLTGFNLSIGITDGFMNALASGRAFPLHFKGEIYREVDPQELWEKTMMSTWDWAEPGVLFIDTINRMNNLWYCETIAATNPCGEQPLPPYGACLLGSFNLAKYITPRAAFSRAASWAFDWGQFMADIPHVVRAMDNVVDYADYPLPQQAIEARSKRRMGLGITGLANAAEALGCPYGSPTFLDFERRVLELLRDGCYEASMRLAQEKGAFPLFDAESYCQGGFIKTLPQELQADIRRHGIRNSHLTSIAPTGTISYTADNVSSGLEPVIMLEGKRRMKTRQGEIIVDIHDYGAKTFGVEGKVADQVTAQEHVDVLVEAALLVDSAVSKTCNVSPDMPWEDFKDLYVSAHQRGAKGCTTFNPGGRRVGIFIPKDAPPREELRESVEGHGPDNRAALAVAASSSCEIDPTSGRRSCE